MSQLLAWLVWRRNSMGSFQLGKIYTSQFQTESCLSPQHSSKTTIDWWQTTYCGNNRTVLVWLKTKLSVEVKLYSCWCHGTVCRVCIQGCIRCHELCVTCHGIGYSSCDTCKLRQDDRCVYECGADYFTTMNDPSTCHHCHSHCMQCHGPTAADCVKCKHYRIFADLALGKSEHDKQDHNEPMPVSPLFNIWLTVL